MSPEQTLEKIKESKKYQLLQPHWQRVADEYLLLLRYYLLWRLQQKATLVNLIEAKLCFIEATYLDGFLPKVADAITDSEQLNVAPNISRESYKRYLITEEKLRLHVLQMSNFQAAYAELGITDESFLIHPHCLGLTEEEIGGRTELTIADVLELRPAFFIWDSSSL